MTPRNDPAATTIPQKSEPSSSTTTTTTTPHTTTSSTPTTTPEAVPVTNNKPTITMSSSSTTNTTPTPSSSIAIPIIDLSNPNKPLLIKQLYEACSTWGFFQLINHGISAHLIHQFNNAMSNFFALPYETKLQLKRNARNARGYFDDELTKRRRDWKECLDVGMPGSRHWDTVEDTHASNACLDGWNQFPSEEVCPNFRNVVVRYFEECARLSNELAVLMARALGVEEGSEEEEFLMRMVGDHTSYLRMNYYPPCDYDDGGKGKVDSGSNNSHGGGKEEKKTPPLGISPHRDAGFLTVLLQDEDCHSLQVARFEDEDHRDGDADCWVTVHPVPGSLTINTGDMAMIWSNGRFRAPLHRVLTDPSKKRYSAPFFYNPGYQELVSPLDCCCLQQSDNDDVAVILEKNDPKNNAIANSTTLSHVAKSNNRNKTNDNSLALEPKKYQPCLWGYFRAVRFAGDLTDLGVEIQTSHFKVGSDSSHVEKQSKFLQEVNFGEAFDVEKYRHILQSGDV